MSVNDLVLISLDDHVIEPSDLFVRHLPAALVDRAPRFAEGPDGPAWYFGRGRSIAWSSDYPDADSPWPFSSEAVAAATSRLADEERAAVTYGNAIDHFGLDPVPAGCNVGELRARRS